MARALVNRSLEYKATITQDNGSVTYVSTSFAFEEMPSYNQISECEEVFKSMIAKYTEIVEPSWKINYIHIDSKK